MSDPSPGWRELVSCRYGTICIYCIHYDMNVLPYHLMVSIYVPQT